MQDQEQEHIVRIGKYAFDNKYCIGQGAFGKVFQGREVSTNKVVAIKQLERTMVSEQEINKEIAILKRLQHPNIVKYEDALQNEDYFYIVTEFCNGGDLRNLLEDSDVEEAEDEERLNKLVDMFFQVCTGFEYLAKFNIIHRDLKPTNILIHNGVYKIADFGVARTEQLHKSIIQTEMVGVPIYMSPQILSKNFYSYKCDVWSLGIIMFEFYFQKQPWKAGDVSGLFFQIMEHPTPYLNQGTKLPPILKNIFENTLRYLEKQRMTWTELLGLQKSRKKIFSDRSKQANPNQNQLDTSCSSLNKSIPPHQAEIISHILSQIKSLDTEMTQLVGSDSYQTFVNTLKRYRVQGIQYRECFIDCSFFILKLAGENLHLYMMDLDVLEESRELLIVLELVHDVIIQKPSENVEDLKKIIGSSFRGKTIEEYAASVISKVNTYRLQALRE